MTWKGNKRGRSQAILLSYARDTENDSETTVYRLRHSSQVHRTTLEQDITLQRDKFDRLKAHVALDDLPKGMTDREAMLKLADWLHRLSVTIEDNWSEP